MGSLNEDPVFEIVEPESDKTPSEANDTGDTNEDANADADEN